MADFVSACAISPDPFYIRYVRCPRTFHDFADACNPVRREARYIDRVAHIVTQLPGWKEQRLPPPRVSQSQYDKVGLTCEYHNTLLFL